MKTPLCYVLTQTRDREYAHLRLTIRHLGDTRFGDSPTAEIRFQTDAENHKRTGGGFWYGYRIEINAKSGAEAARLASAITRVEKTIEERKSEDYAARQITPANLLWALDQAKIGRAVFDGRTDLYTLIGKLPDPALRQWGNRSVSVLAEDAERARRLLAVKTAEYSLSALEEWIAAGKPVTEGRDVAPVVEPLDKLLADPFAPIATPQAPASI
jgi:hypothetical protein